MPGIKSLFLLVGTAFAGLLLMHLGAAKAFFPKTQEVAEKLNANYEKLGSWRVHLQLNGTRDQEIRCWRKKGLWRQEWIDSATASNRVLCAGVGSGRRISAVFPVTADIPFPPLHLDWVRAPSKEWQRLQIEDQIKSYQFLDDRPCIVLGAKYGQLERSQVWIDLERYVPLRLITPSGIIWRWTEYYSLGNHPLPTRLRIEFPQGEIFAFNLSWRQVGTDMSRSHFSPASIREDFGPTDESGLKDSHFRFLLNNLPPNRAGSASW